MIVISQWKSFLGYGQRGNTATCIWKPPKDIQSNDGSDLPYNLLPEPAKFQGLEIGDEDSKTTLYETAPAIFGITIWRF